MENGQAISRYGFGYMLQNSVRPFRAQRENVCGRVYQGGGVDPCPVGNERREELPGANAQGDSLRASEIYSRRSDRLVLEANECFNP